MMQQATLDVQNATYVGIDAHPTEHTAVAVNRFEEEKGTINFANSWDGIHKFLSWLHTVERTAANVIIGIEGRGGKGSAFITLILQRYEHIYEVNPLVSEVFRVDVDLVSPPTAGSAPCLTRRHQILIQSNSRLLDDAEGHTTH